MNNNEITTVKESVKALSVQLINSFHQSIDEAKRKLIEKPKTNSETKGLSGKKKSHFMTFAGVASMAAGGIGWSDDKSWGPWVCLAGIVIVGADIISEFMRAKAKNRAKQADSTGNEAITELKKYDIIERISASCREIESKWDTELGSFKETLLETIKNSKAPEETKVNANYKLYTFQQISYSLKGWISRFESGNSQSEFIAVVDEYENYFTDCIKKACSQQLKAYEEVNHLLIEV